MTTVRCSARHIIEQKETDKKEDLLAYIQSKIYVIRGKKVMLDRDLAELYGVETRTLNQKVKRNIRRFPLDFMFQMTHIDGYVWRFLLHP